MATTIKELHPARRRYPWSKWANGKAWRAVKGEDFACTISGFESSLYNHARRKKIGVRVIRKGNAVEFKFSRPKAAK